MTVVSGDRVKVSVNSELFREQQEGHGGWNDSMNQVSVFNVHHSAFCSFHLRRDPSSYAY